MVRLAARNLLAGRASAALAVLVPAAFSARADGPEVVKIRIDPQAVVSRISPNFIGFGYETSAVAETGYFSPQNSTLSRLYQNLSPTGLVRIGGNISDHTKYVPDGTPTVNTDDKVSVINRAGLVGLSEFLQRAGWKAMWGLNLGTGSREEAVDEATAVAGIFQDRLHSFEIGNEVDFTHGYSPMLTSYDQYYPAYLSYRKAIRAVLPNAPFSGPDSANNFDYLARFAATESSDIKLLTTHYYRSSTMETTFSIDKLLKRDDAWELRLQKLRQLCRERNLSFRVNEVNSVSGGGKPGVSDTFASALWCLDFMFKVASYGGDGVNMETDINHRAFISFYSPIVHDPTGLCHARPEYYGMLAFSLAAKGDLIRSDMDRGDINTTSYATKDAHGSIWVTVINKDLVHDAKVEVTLPAGWTTAEAWRLTAPAAESKNHVTLGGSEIAADGSWLPQAPQNIPVQANVATLSVTHASAVLFILKR